MDENISFWDTTDMRGNKFKHVGTDIQTEANICSGGTNTELSGKVNLSVRDGKSKFGKQIIVQFKVEKEGVPYKSSSNWDKHLEVYLPVDKTTIKNLIGLLYRTMEDE